jgi:hypothetical protein
MKKRKSRAFKFERYWLGFSETNDVIHSAWEITNPFTIPTIDFLRRLNATRITLEKWVKNKFQKVPALLTYTMRIIHAVDKADEHMTLQSQEANFRLQLRAHAYDLSTIQEHKWQHRSSVQWLKL